ncbi:DUF3953 domain-containing protein [Lysinibacillus pakistanensis]
MIFFLGLTMLTLRIIGFQRERRAYGLFLIGVFLFSAYVSIQRFIWIK